MPKPKKGARLGSNPAHQKLLLSTLAKQLFVNEAINTTEAKAKMLRPYAEKLITFAKHGDLAARREVLKDIPDRDIVARLFHEIGPRFAERQGGYTRILKLGPRRRRRGDGEDRARRTRELTRRTRSAGASSVRVIRSHARVRRHGCSVAGRRQRDADVRAVEAIRPWTS